MGSFTEFASRLDNSNDFESETSKTYFGIDDSLDAFVSVQEIALNESSSNDKAKTDLISHRKITNTRSLNDTKPICLESPMPQTAIFATPSIVTETQETAPVADVQFHLENDLHPTVFSVEEVTKNYFDRNAERQPNILHELLGPGVVA